MLALLYWISAFLAVPPPSSEIIDGYTNHLSAFPGDSVELFLNSKNATKYNLKLYDLSGNHVFSVITTVSPQSPSTAKPYEEGYGYNRTKKIKVPHLPSGVYLWDNQIPFIIKTRSAKITIVYSSNTVNAYCNAGGKSLYGFNSSEKISAHTVSFLRPCPLPKYSEAFLRWIQKEKFPEVGYITDQDLEDYNSIKKSKIIIISGHSEYWTLQARKNFDRFVHSGNNALILSGNTMWWQVRYNKSKDQLICYRDAINDPIKTQRLKTTMWCEPILQYPITNSTGTDFRNAGYGQKNDKGWDGYKIIKTSPLLTGTKLKPGDILHCPSDETDGVPLLTFENGIPLIDYQALGFQKIEIVGYDHVTRGGKDGVATWIVFKPTLSSGTVINTASTDWCSFNGIGSNRDIQQITRTMIVKLFNNDHVFSNEPDLASISN